MRDHAPDPAAWMIDIAGIAGEVVTFGSKRFEKPEFINLDLISHHCLNIVDFSFTTNIDRCCICY